MLFSDALTSTRSRGKFPSDKLSEIRNYDSILKTSYELSQYNSFGNASTPQKNGAKRTLNLPYHNSVKIIPLTKVSSQIK